MCRGDGFLRWSVSKMFYCREKISNKNIGLSKKISWKDERMGANIMKKYDIAVAGTGYVA